MCKLKTIDIKGKPYVEVYERIKEFRNNPKYSLLEAPKVSYDFKAETLYVKLCFKELMDDDKKYYLCIRKKEDAFQNVPIVKIDIDYTMDELILKK